MFYAATDGNRPLSPTHELATQMCLVATSPCDMDTSTRIATIEEMIHKLKEKVDGDSENPGHLGLKAMVGFGQESKRRQLENCLNDIATYKQEKVEISTFNREIGAVIATSGRRTMESKGYCWPFDWALIHLRSERPMKNIVTN